MPNVTIHRPPGRGDRQARRTSKLRKEVSDVMGVPAHIIVTEVRKPELDAQLVAGPSRSSSSAASCSVARDEARADAMRLGALGIKVNVARPPERRRDRALRWYRGPRPLHTLRADIDYGFAEAKPRTGSSASGVGLQGRDLRFHPDRPGEAGRHPGTARRAWRP